MNKLIKTRRKELGITLEEIGNYVGVSKTTVMRWENGDISNMRSDKIKKLCEILQLVPENFLSMETCKENGFVDIPVLGHIVADVPITLQQDIVGYEKISAEMAENDVFFALKIKDNSMEPRIAEGDTVIVRQQNDVESGDVAVVLADGEVSCRKVIKHTDGIVLMANNPNYRPRSFTASEFDRKSFVIIGRIVELRVRF